MTDNRTALLQSALRLFAGRGYEAVGVQEIVEAAGVTKPTLYHYFGSKQGLLEALLDQHLAPFLEDLRRAADYAGDLPGTLENTARSYFSFARRHPTFFRLQLALFFGPQSGETYAVVGSRLQDQQHILERLFQAAERDHGNMRGRSHFYSASFMGLLNTCISLALAGNVQLDEATLYQAVRQFQYGIYS